MLRAWYIFIFRLYATWYILKEFLKGKGISWRLETTTSESDYPWEVYTMIFEQTKTLSADLKSRLRTVRENAGIRADVYKDHRDILVTKNRYEEWQEPDPEGWYIQDSKTLSWSLPFDDVGWQIGPYTMLFLFFASLFLFFCVPVFAVTYVFCASIPMWASVSFSAYCILSFYILKFWYKRLK